ncbi:MAG: hypothetical protein HY755_05970 [Nitrospirae bacterium]|nr:hypothetical protein [Nitrospirota bacterium]
MSIDLNAKQLIVLTMQKSKLIKNLIILFLLLLFIFAPSIDSIACDDCTTPLQGKGLDANDNVCPLCFNPIEGFASDSYKTLLLGIPFKNQTAIIVYLEVFFPINKPPQT